MGSLKKIIGYKPKKENIIKLKKFLEDGKHNKLGKDIRIDKLR